MNEELIEKIWYIKRYSDTRYFNREDAKKELEKIFADKIILDKQVLEWMIRDYELRMKSEQTILKNADQTKLTEIIEAHSIAQCSGPP